jgi:hypothetical protein
MADIHPFYEAHRDAMEAAMRQRLDLAEPILRERTQLPDLDKVRQEVLAEFEIVLSQIPYVGGAANRMSDFFMRLIGFMAIGRVLSRHGVAPPVIAGIESETHKAHLLTVDEFARRRANHLIDFRAVGSSASRFFSANRLREKSNLSRDLRPISLAAASATKISLPFFRN